jgi:cation diffusion facilitator CzcD-associated flavoprotein CzcO
MTGLPALEAALQRDLALLQYPKRAWVPARTTPDGQAILDVLIVGGGQGGLAAAAALKREKVTNILVVDRNPPDRAGPWLNFARMNTLRTPKHLTGPDMGIPNLTIQAWWEAQHGEGSWEQMGLVPKESWAAYLAWYRRMLDLPVQAETELTAMRWDAGAQALEATVRRGGSEETLYARRVVLATGIEGSGDWHVPSFITDALPKERYAHTRWDIDFDALRGKRVAVLGAGASAFDNASVALEHGAATVDLFFRRDKLVNVNAYRWAEFVGFLRHVGDLDDASRWKFIRQILRMGQLPPTDTFERARKHDGFTLHPSSPWTSVRETAEGVVVTTPKGEHTCDFVIAGTGFVTDLSLRPELAAFREHIVLWNERYTPPEGEEHPDLARHPYLGPNFEFLPRSEETPWVRNVYNYTFGCLLSRGFGGASISGMKYSIPRLVGGITRSLFAEDSDAHFQSLCDYAVEEF